MIRHSVFNRLLAVAVLTGAAGMVQGQVLSAFQVNNRYDRPVGKEGSPEIMAAKASQPNAGSMVYFYWRNPGDAPREVVDLRWNGKDYAYWNGADGDYLAIWRAFRPKKVASGTVGEVALCLRSAFEQATDFELVFDDGSSETVKIAPQDGPARFGTIAFDSDLRHARCFVEESATEAPAVSGIVVDGKPAELSWWSDEPVNGLRVAELTFEQPLTRGERLTFLAMDRDGAVLAGASLRAFSDLATFGTYGFGDLRRYAENGLDSFNSFVAASKSALDQAEALRMRIVSGAFTPDPATAGHPAIYAYLLLDEPDCHDYGKWPERPLKRRLGGYAPEMLQRYETVVAGDPGKPALLTLDLTFTPYNYFVYAPLADISNPDIYTNTCGWSVKYIDHHLSMIKRAAAPRPFAYTYQSCWEEWSKLTDGWASKKEVLEKGFDHFRDTDKKPRGFGFNTNPDEIAIAMHYALQNGASALFAYTDATETGSGLLFHGSDVLPENWAAVGRNSRKFARIGSLLSPAHPVTLAKATGPVQAGTLLADRDHLLVVVVNENYDCGADAFTLTESDTTITLPLPPWLKGGSVLRVSENGFEPVAFQTGDGELRWNARVRNGEIYLVSSSEDAAQSVVAADAERERLAAEALTAEETARRERENRMRQLREQGDAIDGTPVQGYWVHAEEFPARADGSYNGLESWEEKGSAAMGAEWLIPVEADQTGREHTLLWQGRIYGTPAQVVLTAPDGGVVFERSVDLSASEGRLWSFTPGVAGQYKLRTVGSPAEPVEHGSRIMRQLFRLVK